MLLGDEDWQIVFQAYAEQPILALILAQHLECLKGLIDQGPTSVIEAQAALNRAIKNLQPPTNYRDADRETYRLAVTGKLSPKDDADLKRPSK
jgi:predicted transcriptional regulator